MNKEYIKPEMIINHLNCEDIMTTSNKTPWLSKASDSGDYSTNDPSFLKFFIAE